VSDEVELIELAFEPIDVEPEPEILPAPAYLTAPQSRRAAVVTGRAHRAARLGALVVGFVAALVWFARPAPQRS